MQTTDKPPVDIAADNTRFYRSLSRFGVGWLAISAIFVIWNVQAILNENRAYLQDWHTPVIILLSCSAIGIYWFSFFRRFKEWPPPTLYALAVWICMYVIVTTLTLINSNFSWDFFLLFGVTFPLFPPKYVVALSIILFVSICGYNNLLTLPMTGDKISSIVGLFLGFFGSTTCSLWIQQLITDRFERVKLLQQLDNAHTELEQAHRQLAASAVHEQELAVLRERTRLAREMHDTLGHALVLVSVKLEAAQRLRELDPERCDRELESTKEIVRSSMKELRASIARLRSPALEKESASRAISRYAQEMAQRASVQVTYDLCPGVEELPGQIEETLWKIGQEALTNIEKHAHASNVLLHLSRSNGYVIMKIQDDGIGLPVELQPLQRENINARISPEGHYGLSGIIERVEDVGGRLYVQTGPAKGTIVEVELPLVEAPL